MGDTDSNKTTTTGSDKKKESGINIALQEFFNSLSPKNKRRVVVSFIAILIVIFLTFAYYSRQASVPQAVVQKAPKKKSIDFAETDNERAMRLSFESQFKDLVEQNKELDESRKQELADLKEQIRQMQTSLGQSENQELVDGVPQGSPLGNVEVNSYPASPNQNIKPYDIPAMINKSQDTAKQPVVIKGGIQHIHIEQATQETKEATVARKKLINFIPSGTVLKATLTNGMYAPTMSKGDSTPYPAHMRLWDMGFLPNEKRKDLSGCYVMGEAIGKLADSRAHIRLARLSCISNDEKKVLEKDIKGFVVGDDGKVGVYGEIRANFGKVALTALLAEFLASAGDTVKSASQNVTVNPLGGTTTTFPKTGDILQSAAASGFGEAARMIADFYLEIMREMTPVIEVHGRRDVEIIVDVGLELTTDDFVWEGVKEDESIKGLADILNDNN